MKYNHKKIEKKWQDIWENATLYRASYFSKKPKYYALIEFPYPSGDGLHVGHVRSYTAMDIVARKRRMEGYNVLYPIGWDAFGLPTENYAIKTGAHPAEITKKNTDTFRRQLKSLGFSFDWDREINTADPKYYKWTQWMFLKFFEKGLAYKARTEINWCPRDKIGLANEEVVGGVCERCGTQVEKREKEQWMIRITEYAEELLKGLSDIDYIPEAKVQQKNWIGKSEGALIDFKIQDIELTVQVFTTRPDTIFGATFLVVGPEHVIIRNLKDAALNKDEVENYIVTAKRKTDEERVADKGEKTGVELKGVKAINPANGAEISVWIADYVLGNVGTGAIMAVPAHDIRDHEFAQKHFLEIIHVVEPSAHGGSADDIAERLRKIVTKEVYTGSGTLIHSGMFNGIDSEKAKKEIVKKVGGRWKIQYRLRDWIFSRQRYWGEPIPLIYCANCKEWIPVLEKDLPVELPQVEQYIPTDTGESPLATISSWVETTCPRCGGEARRETDVMPNWAGSSWYFLRYADPKNKKEFADAKKLKYFMPVDWYNGGMEHTVLHLLYSRFWNIFLYNCGLVPVAEPYKKRTSHGLILGEGGMKMSKSKGNVVNPDTACEQFGADSLRMYEMFIGPFNQSTTWDPRGILGVRRFLDKVCVIADTVAVKKKNKDLEKFLHKTIKKVSEDIESMSFNTAVSALMIFINECSGHKEIPVSIWKNFLKLLAPFAPHLTEELWSELGYKKSVHKEMWPEFNPVLIEEDTFELVIQINGKVRDTVIVSKTITEQQVRPLAFASEHVKKSIGDKPVRKIIFVAGKVFNIVI